MSIRLEGDRVVLRRFYEAEIGAMWERELARGGSGDRARYARFLQGSGGWQGDELRLAVEAGGELVGDVQARRSRVTGPDGVTEIGIGLFEEARGRGIGTEAVRLLADHLFDDGFHRVQLSTDADNAAMRGAAERAGFRFEGILRGYWRDDSGIRDYALYARTYADHLADMARRRGT